MAVPDQVGRYHLINKRQVGIGPIQVDTLLFLGGLALVLSYSAYVAEVFRAGIDGVHESQRAAPARSALSNRQTTATSCCHRRSAGSSRR